MAGIRLYAGSPPWARQRERQPHSDAKDDREHGDNVRLSICGSHQIEEIEKEDTHDDVDAAEHSERLSL